MANDPNSRTDERRTAAWIGPALHIEGRIISQENLTIDGTIEGTIEVTTHNLTIGPGASVKADLAAGAISVSGRVTGNISATERVDLSATASVDGDIAAPRLVMADGATVKGKVQAGKKRD